MRKQSLLKSFLVWRLKHISHKQFIYFLSIIIGLTSGLIAVIIKIPRTTDKILGITITEKFDIPETFIAVISSVFFIFKKNQIPDNKITNGKK